MLKKSAKKKAVKFILAPRPQKDPLAADIDAPQHVLVPKDGSKIEDVRKRLPDFDPDLFTSNQETKTGMLERAHNADGITFDSDILRAMSKDFDFDDPNNVLDDDFLDQAGGLIEDEGEMIDGEMTDLTRDLFNTEPQIVTFNYDKNHEDNKDENEEEDSDADQVREGDEDEDDQDERRTIFTNYSMTSSVMRRSQGLQQLDEHFERLYEKEYADDTEIGALDLNEVKGGEELLSNIDQIKEMKREIKIVRKKNHGDDYEPELVSNHHKGAVIGDEPNAELADLVDVEVKVRENRVDCESILSYNSNIYNHPKLISEPRKRTASKDKNSMDVEMESSGDDSRREAKSAVLAKLSRRPQNESQEEKRARKKAVKAYRSERRQERKSNQKMYKSEQIRLIEQQRNNAPALKLV